MSSRWARFARGWLAAAFATFVAAFAHTVAGDQLPSPVALLATLMLSATVCVLLAGKSVSLVRLSAGIAISQAIYHLVFAAGGTSTVLVSTSHHETALVITDAAAHAHGSMWIAHTLAAVVTVLAFRYGEGAFWGILSTTRSLFQAILGTLVTAPTALGVTPARAVEAATRRPLLSVLLLSPLRHRGPPSALAS